MMGGVPVETRRASATRSWQLASVILVVAIAVTASACSNGSHDSSFAASTAAPTATEKPPSSIGAGEGSLRLIAWDGYAQRQWVRPFEQRTGCMVHVSYAATSSKMVSLMGHGGGGRYDLVSASGDADQQLISSGDVKPVNIALIPSWKDFRDFLRSPSFNTVKGVHFGTSLQFGPNILLSSTKSLATAPASWRVLYSTRFAGKITVPNNPIQIADAALYLREAKPALDITDPYELNQQQFNAAVQLLTAQKPLVARYWKLARDEIRLFQSGKAVVGPAWPYQRVALQQDGVAVKDSIPKQGATGWADSWLLASKAPHPNCAYKWMAYVSSPKVQAEQAISFGETPANPLACPIMDQLQPGSCAGYLADKPDAYFRSIRFWKLPTSLCDNGRTDCVPYSRWTAAWSKIAG